MKLAPEILEKIKMDSFSPFKIKSGEINDIKCYLVSPDKGEDIEWRGDNLIFRSSVWNQEGELLSAGFKYFVNNGQSPDIFPPLKSLDGCKFIEKPDGSAIIIDYINGGFSVRTRGTLSIDSLDFAEPLKKCLEDKQIFEKLQASDLCGLLGKTTFIYEFCSRSNKVVIDYPEDHLILIGAVNKQDYSLMTQDNLDEVACKFGFSRPKQYDFKSFEDLGKIEGWEKTEGVCAYSPCGQEIRKFKTNYWRVRSHFKNNLNLKSVYELIQFGDFRSEAESSAHIEKEYDWECAQESKSLIKEVFKGKATAEAIKSSLNYLIYGIAGNGGIADLPRKEQASQIMKIYKNKDKSSNFAWVAFSILDKKFGKEQEEKLIKQCLGL